MILSKLYLGHAVGLNGETVAEESFDLFLRTEVTPLFPGFTAVDANGYWAGFSEKTTILEIIHTEADSFKVSTIADHYKVIFEQDSVLILTISAEGVEAQF